MSIFFCRVDIVVLHFLVAKKELKLGRVLGRGGFCVVSEVTNIVLSQGDNQAGGGRKSDDEHYIHNAKETQA